MGVRGRDDEGHFLGYQSCRNCGQDTDEWDEPDPTEYCKICNSECTPDPDCEPYTLDGNGPFCGEHWVEQGIAEHNAWKERALAAEQALAAGFPTPATAEAVATRGHDDEASPIRTHVDRAGHHHGGNSA